MINGKKYILIADDEKEIRDILELMLKGEGYEVLAIEDGSRVLERASSQIDLYILDVNMPKLSGFQVAAELRKTYDTPIIFLTAYSTESDKVMGFLSGADDYLVKPFSNMELILRIKAILRRGSKRDESNEEGDSRIRIHDLVLDPDNQSVIRGEEIIPLTYTEYKILELLSSHRKKIYSLENIYQSIWEEEAVGDSAIMVHIKNVRKKLGEDSRNPRYIKTAWGKGYYVE